MCVSGEMLAAVSYLLLTPLTLFIQELNTRRGAARIEFASARSCRAECASALFLEENAAMFTLTLKPRKHISKRSAMPA